MDWLALVLSLVKLLGAFSGWLHDRAMLNAGQAQQVAAAMTEQADEIAKAVAARAAARDAAVRDPAGVLRDDDGFRRKG